MSSVHPTTNPPTHWMESPTVKARLGVGLALAAAVAAVAIPVLMSMGTPVAVAVLPTAIIIGAGLLVLLVSQIAKRCLFQQKGEANSVNFTDVSPDIKIRKNIDKISLDQFFNPAGREKFKESVKSAPSDSVRSLICDGSEEDIDLVGCGDYQMPNCYVKDIAREKKITVNGEMFQPQEADDFVKASQKLINLCSDRRSPEQGALIAQRLARTLCTSFTADIIDKAMVLFPVSDGRVVLDRYANSDDQCSSASGSHGYWQIEIEEGVAIVTRIQLIKITGGLVSTDPGLMFGVVECKREITVSLDELLQMNEPPAEGEQPLPGMQVKDEWSEFFSAEGVEKAKYPSWIEGVQQKLDPSPFYQQDLLAEDESSKIAEKPWKLVDVTVQERLKRNLAIFTAEEAPEKIQANFREAFIQPRDAIKSAVLDSSADPIEEFSQDGKKVINSRGEVIRAPRQFMKDLWRSNITLNGEPLCARDSPNVLPHEEMGKAYEKMIKMCTRVESNQEKGLLAAQRLARIATQTSSADLTVKVSYLYVTRGGNAISVNPYAIKGDYSVAPQGGFGRIINIITNQQSIKVILHQPFLIRDSANPVIPLGIVNCKREIEVNLEDLEAAAEENPELPTLQVKDLWSKFFIRPQTLGAWDQEEPWTQKLLKKLEAF